MKYKTVIEIVCDAFDEDEASHTAGEYLCGNEDVGVTMRCKTFHLNGHRMKKYGVPFFTVLALTSLLLFAR